MTKDEAIKIFGKNGVDLADAMGVTRGRVSQLPEVLPTSISDRIVGAAVRLGRFTDELAKTYRDTQQSSA